MQALSSSVLEACALGKFYHVKRGFFHKPALVKAAENISFKLYSGKTLAVVGESGSGKSTLARLIVQSEAPSSGSLFFKGQNVVSMDERERLGIKSKVRMIFQNPYGSLNPRWRIFDTLNEPLKLNTNLSSNERKDKIYALLKKVGLSEEVACRYPHMFSGGQRQRVAIARALVLDPEIIVADEPTSALDVSIQAQILNLMLDLQQEFGVAYLFISHALGVVRYMADDLLVMYFGRVAEYGASSQVFSKPIHPYTRGLLESTPILKTKGSITSVPTVLKGELPSPLNPPTGCAFHTRCPMAISICKENEPQLREVAGRWVACHRAEDCLYTDRD